MRIGMTPHTAWRGAGSFAVTLDGRTAAMMTELQRLVGPKIRLVPTQGSYHAGKLSGGTHCGGGAIDLSVHGMSRADIITVIRHARRIGFRASWWRTYPEWTQGDHIHMIAADQPDLNPVAVNQVHAVDAGYNGLGHLGRGGHDRHRALHVPGATWEKWRRAKAAKRVAAVVVVAVGTTVGGVAVNPGAPKPKPPVVAKPHPKAKTPRVTRLSAKVHPGAHAAQVRDVRAVLVKDGFGPIGEKPADWYGPVTRAAVHHFLAAHPEFGPANDKLGPRGWRWLQIKAGRK